MSRQRVHEVSSPLSLFPFIGILLCTMGALLVILVVVSRSAHDSAVRLVQSRQQQSAQPAIDEVHQKLNEVTTYVGKLAKVKNQAESRLRDEQTRLRDIEDHIRRLHEKMDSLQIAAVELQKMEQEHFDDRQQAEREAARLQKLVDESKKTVDSLREAAETAAKSYAVVPYEGPNGTFRRPIYIECVKNELILQPEGVRLKAEDVRPPFGPGNPLATVLRATRDHLVRTLPGTGASHDTEPYPLLLVRPDGLFIFDHARSAIEAGDFELGFELVEKDWKLKFPQPDPQLATVQQVALEQARARQVLLAAAAPRAYANAAASAEFDPDDGDGDGPSAGSSYASGSGSGSAAGPGGSRSPATRDYLVRASRYGAPGHNDDGDGSEHFDEAGNYIGDNRVGGTPSGNGSRGNTSTSTSLAGGAAGGQLGGSAGGSPSTPIPPSEPIAAARNSAGGGGGNADSAAADPAGISSDGEPGATPVGSNGSPGGSPGGSPSGSSTFAGGALVASGAHGSFSSPGGPPPSSVDKNLVPDGYQTTPGGAAVMMGSSPPAGAAADHTDQRSERERMRAVENRGKDWALRNKPPRAVAVQRTIRVDVNRAQLAVHPDSAGGQPAVIPMPGDTVESIDEFVMQVRNRIDDWGMAGNGLYWKPVVMLHVAPDGQQRARDLARLLNNSGLEVRIDETARNSPQGTAHETR